MLPSALGDTSKQLNLNLIVRERNLGLRSCSDCDREKERIDAGYRDNRLQWGERVHELFEGL